MNLNKLFISNPKFLSAGECTIVLNGEWVTHSGKLVYVRYKDNSVRYYVRSSQKTDNKPVLEWVSKEDTFLLKKIQEPLFCGKPIDFNIPCTEDNLSIEIDSDLRIIFIQTFLYTNIRNMIQSGSDQNVRLNISAINRVLEVNEVQQLVDAFKNEAYKNYLSVAYSNKFMNKIFKAPYNRFYNILKCFIPTLVECKYLYNPLTDNPNFSIKDYQVYKMAESRGRVKVILDNGVLTASLLTHLEICQALGMKNMMRFTPQFLYKLIVGFVVPGDVNFPNIDNKVMSKASNEMLVTGLAPTYTMLRYSYKLNELTKALGEATSPEKKKEIETAIIQLKAYNKTDTLQVCLEQDHTKLVHIGTSNLDDAKLCTVQKLYEYLSSAKLLRSE